jgi:hypothetical protein
VIVTGWRRPDFLAAALHRLRIADEGRQEFVISLDRGHNAQSLAIAQGWVNHMPPGVARIVKRSHPYRGNSFNTLAAYRDAIRPDVDLIHLVEEDVFVGVDYFPAHRAAHALVPDAFAVSLARNQNFSTDPDPDPSAVYLDGRYQSVGVSFRPQILSGILKHVVPRYFSDPIAYCRKHFPRTQIPAGNAEQDGLINRVCEATGGKVVYAARPRAYHAGFVGYHRDGEPALIPGRSITLAADLLLKMDTAELNRRARSYPDHQAVDLNATLEGISRVIDWRG